jgi:hypothetical protein
LDYSEYHDLLVFSEKTEIEQYQKQATQSIEKKIKNERGV